MDAKKRQSSSGTLPKRKKSAIKKASSKKRQSSARLKPESNLVTNSRQKSSQPSISTTKESKHKDVRLNSLSPTPSIAFVASANENKFELLETALLHSGFWLQLEQKYFLSKKEKTEFSILIKPDCDACELKGSTATDPELVEHLIDLLHSRGFKMVNIGNSRNSLDNWLENRDVEILADILGYHYVTAAGNDYDVIDLSETSIAGGFCSGSLLDGHNIAGKWVESDFRIMFSKCKTDDEQAYHLGLNNLISVLTHKDKDYHYKYRLGLPRVLVELYRQVEVDFSLVDAWVSNHGSAGSRVARPCFTKTIIAGNSLLLTDYATIKKMGADVNASPVHSRAISEIGLPDPYRIEGDLSPFVDWINVPPLLLETNRRRAQWVELDQILQPWLQTVDAEMFAFKDPINAKINAWVSSYIQGIDDKPNAQAVLLSINYVLAFIYAAVEVAQVMHWKDSLWHKEAPLNLDADDYPDEEYQAIVDYLEPLEKQALALEADSNGLRWMFYKDGSVLFEFSREIPVDYDDFIESVDITRSIQYMTDYIGGQIIPIKTDASGRVTHQMERNLYLPQPNYLIFYQGQNIDVSKLEYFRYGENEQQMFWRTVKSENGSASYDDGIVRFIKMGEERTLVRISGRQKFTLPWFWEMVNLDNFPVLKERLFNHAYSDFFTRTMANFEAVYEGRDVRIGKRWDNNFGEVDAAQLELPSDKLVALLNQAGDFFERNFSDNEGLLNGLLFSYKPEPELVDEDGFSHFKNEADSKFAASDSADDQDESLQGLIAAGKVGVRNYWQDIYDAILKDSGVRPG